MDLPSKILFQMSGMLKKLRLYTYTARTMLFFSFRIVFSRHFKELYWIKQPLNEKRVDSSHSKCHQNMPAWTAQVKFSITLEIVFTIAAPAFDILCIGCVLNTNVVYTTAEKLTFETFIDLQTLQDATRRWRSSKATKQTRTRNARPSNAARCC